MNVEWISDSEDREQLLAEFVAFLRKQQLLAKSRAREPGLGKHKAEKQMAIAEAFDSASEYWAGVKFHPNAREQLVAAMSKYTMPDDAGLPTRTFLEYLAGRILDDLAG
jgi:hypothetical protein